VLPSAGVICICGVGSEDPSPCVVVVVVLVVVVVVVVVPPSGTVSPTPTVVPRAQHAPTKRARQIINASFIWIVRMVSQEYICGFVLKSCWMEKEGEGRLSGALRWLGGALRRLRDVLG